MSKITCLCGSTISSNEMPEFMFHMVSEETYALLDRLSQAGGFTGRSCSCVGAAACVGVRQLDGMLAGGR